MLLNILENKPLLIGLAVGVAALVVLVILLFAIRARVCHNRKIDQKNKLQEVQESAVAEEKTVKDNQAEAQPAQEKQEVNEAKPQKTKQTKTTTKKQTQSQVAKSKEQKAKTTQQKAKVTKQTKEPKTEGEQTKAKEVAAPKARAEKYMITYSKEEKLWVVKKTGAQRASKKFKTKVEAVEFAQRISEEKGMALTVKKKDGKFQKSSNI